MPHSLGLTPSKIIAAQLVYRSRLGERRVPDFPSYTLKPPSSLGESGAEVSRPRGCQNLTFEGEVAVVIGRRAHRVTREHALEHVAYYAPAIDFGVRELQSADPGSNLRAKGIDGFTPIGPELLDARGATQAALRLRTWVNGRLVQDTADDKMLFDAAYMIADLSRLVTLESGDILLTGSPAGNGRVEPGDVVEVSLGDGPRLRSPIVEADHELEPIGALPESVPPGASPVCERAWEILRRVGTATLSAQLRRRGVDNVFVERVTAVRPDLRLLGYARTLRYGAAREDVFEHFSAGMNVQKQTIDTLAADDVLMIEARGETTSGTLGDLLALRASRCGAGGIVTDGGLRDHDAVAAIGLPVYCAGKHAAVMGRRHVPLDAGIPITCGDVLVLDGDVVVGDADGVIVLPRALAEEVAFDAEAQEIEECFIAARLEDGESLDGLFPLGDRWRPAFEQWRSGQTDGDPGG